MENSILSWLLLILNMVSYFLIGNKQKIGFIIGLIGCIIGIMIFSLSIPLIIMYVGFGILNLINYIKWQK